MLFMGKSIANPPGDGPGMDSEWIWGLASGTHTMGGPATQNTVPYMSMRPTRETGRIFWSYFGLCFHV